MANWSLHTLAIHRRLLCRLTLWSWTVSLGLDAHHELITEASSRGFWRFQDFADYYEDAEIAVDDLAGLAAQVRALHAQVGSTDLQCFLDDLSELIGEAKPTAKRFTQ